MSFVFKSSLGLLVAINITVMCSVVLNKKWYCLKGRQNLMAMQALLPPVWGIVSMAIYGQSCSYDIHGTALYWNTFSVLAVCNALTCQVAEIKPVCVHLWNQALTLCIFAMQVRVIHCGPLLIRTAVTWMGMAFVPPHMLLYPVTPALAPIHFLVGIVAPVAVLGILEAASFTEYLELQHRTRTADVATQTTAEQQPVSEPAAPGSDILDELCLPASAGIDSHAMQQPPDRGTPGFTDSTGDIHATPSSAAPQPLRRPAEGASIVGQSGAPASGQPAGLRTHHYTPTTVDAISASMSGLAEQALPHPSSSSPHSALAPEAVPTPTSAFTDTSTVVAPSTEQYARSAGASRVGSGSLATETFVAAVDASVATVALAPRLKPLYADFPVHHSTASGQTHQDPTSNPTSNGHGQGRPTCFPVADANCRVSPFTVAAASASETEQSARRAEATPASPSEVNGTAVNGTAASSMGAGPSLQGAADEVGCAGVSGDVFLAAGGSSAVLVSPPDMNCLAEQPEEEASEPTTLGCCILSAADLYRAQTVSPQPPKMIQHANAGWKGEAETSGTAASGFAASSAAAADATASPCAVSVVAAAGASASASASATSAATASPVAASAPTAECASAPASATSATLASVATVSVSGGTQAQVPTAHSMSVSMIRSASYERSAASDGNSLATSRSLANSLSDRASPGLDPLAAILRAASSAHERPGSIDGRSTEGLSCANSPLRQGFSGDAFSWLSGTGANAATSNLPMDIQLQPPVRPALQASAQRSRVLPRSEGTPRSGWVPGNSE